MKNSEKMYASDATSKWDSIEWETVEKKVRLLQSRIVKAKKAGKNRKVKSLQWILAHSYYAKLSAVKRVTGNKGKNTPGIDGVTWAKPSDKANAVFSLTRKGYKASPLRRVYIPKANGKMRTLGIPTMKDRAMQALYLLALDPVAEVLADTNSYGFRPQRSCADALRQCFCVFKGQNAASWILEADIKSCFDNISHEWLVNNIPMDSKILKAWLKAGFIENDSFFQTKEGTPQGGIISPVLANLTLDGLEALLHDCGKRILRGRNKKLRGLRSKVNFVRYADDFIVTASCKEDLQEVVLPALVHFLSVRGLTLHPEKTKITHINDGFDFLGQNVRKYNRKLLIKPSKKSIKSFRRKVINIIKKGKGLPTEKLIYQLNPILIGWANYHRFAASKQVFTRLDNDIFHALWRWARSRHNHNVSRAWIRYKYFKSIGSRNWVFSAKDGRKVVSLFLMESTPVRRFIKIKNGMNPYDPMHWDYFNQRKLNRVRYKKSRFWGA